ncbi:uncharacterized protein [Nicotiana tomentosiformis]|uniref:uncharacterized protein n=1 Tax=Nicotiana tomentosiformis TaxID=4098 RepID=UPI00388CD323
MAKTSKTVPQQEAASSSRPVGAEDAVEPRPEEFVPVGCSTVIDFKVLRYRADVSRSRGLGKDVAMRPLSSDEEVPAPKQALVLHHESFLRIREEYEAEVRNLTEKSDSYKLLSEKLQADLETSRDEHKEIVEQIDKIKELQHLLDFTTSDKVRLADELEVARSEVAVARSEVAVAKSEVAEANKRANAKVAQFRINVEVNQAKAKSIVEHAEWKARREALEEIDAAVEDSRREQGGREEGRGERGDHRSDVQSPTVTTTATVGEAGEGERGKEKE